MRFRLVRDWIATRADPVGFGAGDPVGLSGRSDLWDGHLWLWARDARGGEGWIPDTALTMRNGEVRARHAFSAAELTCRAGELLEGLEATHGWVRCRAESGVEGWVPARHLHGPC